MREKRDCLDPTSVEISWWVQKNLMCLSLFWTFAVQSTVFVYISKQNLISPDKQKIARLSRCFFCDSKSDCSSYFTAMTMYELWRITATSCKKSTPQLVFGKFCNMYEESMENFQGIHASVITALRCSKTGIWNFAGLQIFSLTPELQTRNPLDSRLWTGMPSDGKIPDPEFHQTPEL